MTSALPASVANGVGGSVAVDAGLYIPVPEHDVVGCLSDGAHNGGAHNGGAHNGGGLNGQDAYTGRILAAVSSGAFPWPQEVADPLTSNEAKTYTHEGTTFRTRNVVPHDFDVDADEGDDADDGADGEPQGFYTTDGRFNGIPPAGLSPPLKVGTGTGGTGNTGAAYLSSEALAFNGYQRTVAAVASPLTASDNNKVEIGVLAPAGGADAFDDEPPAYCYPDADQLGYAPGEAPGEAPTLAASAGDRRMIVRRLTPRECERLQGFPSVFFQGTFSVCLCSDRHQKNARAAQTSHKSQSSACLVEEQECCVLAPAASDPLSASPPSYERRAVVRALIDLERSEVQLLNQGKSSSLAKSAPSSVSFPLPTEVAASVLRLVEQSRSQEKDLPHGEVGSLQSTMLSTAPSCGKRAFEQSGKEMQVAAENAQRSTNEESRLFRFTTSPADRDSPTSGLISPTLCSCVWTAIASFIPERTLPQSSCFDVSLEIVHGWTLIPWKNKPAVDCPDGPRYKALGNSMAVPCMRWIGRRIDAHLKGSL